MLQFVVAAPPGMALTERLRIKPTLCYEDASPVLEEGVFKLLTPTSALVLGPGLSEVRVEFRIEKVSRKVGARDYCLRVDPDYGPGPLASGPAARMVAASVNASSGPTRLHGVCSTPITVLSKRPRGERQTAAGHRAAAREQAFAAVSAAAAAESAAYAAAASAAVGSAGRSSASASVASSGSNSGAPTPLPPVQPGPAGGISGARAALTSATSPGAAALGAIALLSSVPSTAISKQRVS